MRTSLPFDVIYAVRTTTRPELFEYLTRGAAKQKKLTSQLKQGATGVCWLTPRRPHGPLALDNNI